MRSRAWLICALPSVVLACTNDAESTRPSSAATTTITPTTADASTTPSPAEPLRACPATYSGVVAVDAASGDFTWNHCGAEDETLRVAGATESLVYVGSWSSMSNGSADVVALDVATGKPKFEIPIPAMNESFHLDALHVRGPFAANDVIVLSVLEDSIIFTVGYDASNGDELWRSSELDGVVAANADGVVIVAEPSVYVSDVPGTHRVIAGLDRTTGEQLWHFDDPSVVEISVVEDRVLLTRLDAATREPTSSLLVDALAGTRVWESESIADIAVPSGANLVSLHVADFTKPDQAIVAAVDSASGETIWTQPASALGSFGAPIGGVYAAPLAAGDEAVYVRQEASLVALDASNGDQLWSSGLDAVPIISLPGGLLALTADDLQLIEPADGARKWSSTLGVTSRITNIVADSATAYVSWR